MLEGLDRIDWENISHSHGKAGDFPGWIRDLASDDRETRQQALEELWEFSNHQGSIYEVTPYVIPFLIELLQAETVQDKVEILAMMVSITTPCRRDVAQSWYGGNERQTLLNVKEGIPVYVDLLNHPTPLARQLAFELIVAIKGELWDQAVQEPLQAAVAREADPQVKAEMVTSLGQFLLNCYIPKFDLDVDQYSGPVAFLKTLLEPPEHEKVRFRAALALIDFLRDTVEMSDVMVGILKDVLLDPTRYARYDSPVTASLALRDALDGLRFLHLDQRTAVLEEVLPQVQQPQDAHEIARALLDLAFYGFIRPHLIVRTHDYKGPVVYYNRLPDDYPVDRPDNSQVAFRVHSWQTPEEARASGRLYDVPGVKRNVRTLTPEQRRVLALVVGCDVAWMRHSNLLEMYGLPVRRDEVRAALAGEDGRRAGRLREKDNGEHPSD
jgi:hypothetical protein